MTLFDDRGGIHGSSNTPALCKVVLLGNAGKLESGVRILIELTESYLAVSIKHSAFQVAVK